MPERPEPVRRRPEVRAGTIVGVFGIHGELKLAASRIGEDALRPGLDVVARFADHQERGAVIGAIRRHQGRPLLAFVGVEDVAGAQPFTGAELFIARDDAPLGPGEYFDEDLIGCTLVDPAGTSLGRVVDVAHYPAQDMLVVGSSRALVPLVGAFVSAIDVERKEIRVTVPPGLLDPAAADEA